MSDDGTRAHRVTETRMADGSILLASGWPQGPVARRTGDWLDRWARETPDRVFLAERSGAGWRRESYGAVHAQVRALAAGLLDRGLGPERPVLVASGNSIGHALLALACQYVGIPVAPVAEQYALIPEARGRLVHAVGMLTPGLVYVEDAARLAEALALPCLDGIEIAAARPDGAGRKVTALEALAGPGRVDDAAAAVGPDTVAKVLLTSGSSSSPKGVTTTHRMLCVNQAQLADGFPFLHDPGHVVLDWLPWNHVFGGSHNFNMMLANGGTLQIDDGRPVRGRFARTLENLALAEPVTLSFNVPLGYGMLLDGLRADAALADRFFERLRLMFYAGATLPPEVWAGFEALAAARGRAPMLTSSWGMTETAPCCLLAHAGGGPRAGNVGVPVTGAEARLLPAADGRHEIRVRGPNVMPGYWRDPAKTAESFDAEGFLITGDAVRFAEPGRPEAGLVFDGRLSEDFKLASGTWVRATGLRTEVLSKLAGLAADVVLTGADRADIGLLVFPDPAAVESMPARDGLLDAPGYLSEVARRLGAGGSSSTRIARIAVLADPPDVGAQEITAKGNLNPRRVLTNRAALVERLHGGDPAVRVT